MLAAVLLVAGVAGLVLRRRRPTSTQIADEAVGGANLPGMAAASMDNPTTS